MESLGMPMYRRERDSGDLIAGPDFLSFLLAPPRRASYYYEPDPPSENYDKEERLEESLKQPHQPPQEDYYFNNELYQSSSEPKDNGTEDGTIISVSVSSSVGHSMINKQVSESKQVQEAQEAIRSEEAPQFVAEASKSEFSVEEGEPISLPYEPQKNFRETVIYHNHPNNKARSVSYSTVIQSIPEHSWGKSGNQSLPSMEESKDYYVTAKYNDSLEMYQQQHQQQQQQQQQPSTEKPWAPSKEKMYQKARPYRPVVYVQPEQNYEVDEAISVETNGRAHGVQPAAGVPKKDDNQKVGYVVEGRNYRKYRVEERTSDGFIVGEYGVVRHDDGSLRGVRYTADGTISPRLIYDALMKFLSL